MRILTDRTRQALLQLAQQCDFLLFGEMHGTQEVPQLLAELLDDLAAVGYGGLGLEFSMYERENFMRWGRGEADALPFYYRLPPSDGRANQQDAALVRQAVEKGWQVLCFDRVAGDWQEPSPHPDLDPEAWGWQQRDSSMADNLAEQWKQHCPDRKVVGVCGNLHSRLVPTEGVEELWPSFAACFQQRNPQWVVRTVDLVFHGGAFFNDRRVQQFPLDPLAEAELREEPAFGHSCALHLPWATPPTFFVSPAE
jgi:hypothetical protein